MNKVTKIGMLFLLFVVPIFLVIFFEKGSSNEYMVKNFPGDKAYLEDENGEIKRVPEYKLTDQQGKVFSSDQLKGKVYVADFVFTRCTGICPKMTSQLTRVQEKFAEKNDVVLVTYTVDPEYDSVGAMNGYAEEYKAIYGKWYMLTGAKADIYDLANNGYMVAAAEEGEEQFVHTPKFTLVDKKGRIRGYYDGTKPEDVDKLMTEIDVVLQEKE
jgi:protein SCO1/2